jgi:hypothetical protein
VRHFASIWKIQFLEKHPLQRLLFALLRSRGVHILDNSPCFLTTAHSQADCEHIVQAFKESVVELQAMDLLPRRRTRLSLEAAHPILPGARLGRDAEGRPGWYVPDPARSGKYMKVGT